MSSLFQGSPQKATSYTTSASETPKWMQDAIYNQIQWATNVANSPFPQYNMPRVAELSPLQQQAYRNVVGNQGFYQGALDRTQGAMEGYASAGTATPLGQAQAGYLRPGLVSSNLGAGQEMFGRAGEYDVVGAAQPLLGQAQQATAQALSGSALQQASPYLQSSAQSAADTVGSYMSPYQQNVLDVIAKQGGRNLRENLLPNVSDAFIRAGQFGSSRMGEMGSRAVRDTQEAVLNAQAQAAQQGYGQALGAAQTDLARQAQLAGTVGSIGGSDLSRVLQGGAQFGNLGQVSGQLTGQQMQNLSSLAQAQTQAGQVQQQFGMGAAQAEQQARAADYQRQMSALQQMAALQQQEQAMRAADVASLETAGQAQQGQQQRQLDAAYQQFMERQMYPKQQLDWLSTQIRGMAPITPQTQTQATQTTGQTYSPSPLSQLAAGVYAYKGLSGLGG